MILPPADGSDPPANSTATVAGWGEQIPFDLNPPEIPAEAPPSVDKLRKVDLTVRPREDCKKLENEPSNPLIQNAYQAMICAGGDGKSPCHGDSGGPLVQEGKVIGIVARTLVHPSFIQCNKAPFIFTRVSNYIPFITENLGGQTIDEEADSLLHGNGWVQEGWGHDPSPTSCI
ncbi:Peptidase S1/S6, chymotrypsin/Hap [Metarhizium brunneum]